MAKFNFGAADDVANVLGNGTNGASVVNAFGEAIDKGAGAALGLSLLGFAAGIGSTAETVANTKIFPVKAIPLANVVAGGGLAAVDANDLYEQYTTTGNITAAKALSFAGNALAFAGGLVLLLNPASLAVGASLAVLSVAVSAASNMVGDDVNLIENAPEKVAAAADKLKEMANSDIASGKAIDNFFDNHVSPLIDGMIEKTAEFDKFMENLKDVLTDSKTYDPTELLEAMLKPVMEFAQEIGEFMDGLMDDIMDKFRELSNGLTELMEGFYGYGHDLLGMLPDDLAKLLTEWTGLNRSGTHYIYDPLVLDLDGDGIETVGVNDETYEMVS